MELNNKELLSLLTAILFVMMHSPLLEEERTEFKKVGKKIINERDRRRKERNNV